MFTALLSTVDKIQKPPTSPSIYDWIKDDMAYIYTHIYIYTQMQYYTTIKR